MAQQITLPGTAPSRTTPSTFSTLMDAFLAWLVTVVPQFNTLSTEAEADALTAETAAATATAAKSVAQATANYKGAWSDQVGAAAVPYAVSHLEKYWQLVSNIADVTAKTPGTDAEWIQITGTFSRTNKTQANSPVTLVTGDCDGFKTFTNTGATGETQFNLPAGADGLKCNFMVTAAQYLKVLANGTEVFRYGSSTSAAGGYIRDNTIGNCFTIEWSGTQWVVVNLTGTLNVDE